jgi:alpha-beta hydrolase superfamily lysophospholipase
MGEATLAGSEGAVFYRVWDAGEPRRIVMLVHGYAEHGGRYAHVADALVRGGSLVTAPDHIGHGRTDGERGLIGDFDHVVADLHHLAGILTAAHPGLPLVVIGHSMGGLLTARLAQEHPDEVAAIGFLGAVLGDWAWARDVLSMPEIPYQEPEYSGMSRDPEAVRGYAGDPLVYHGQYKRPLLAAEVGALDRFNERIDRLTMPVLFLHGAADPYVPYRASLDAVARMASDDKTMRVFPGARHELVNEVNRDEVIATIAVFVERFGAPRLS